MFTYSLADTYPLSPPMLSHPYIADHGTWLVLTSGNLRMWVICKENNQYYKNSCSTHGVCHTCPMRARARELLGFAKCVLMVAFALHRHWAPDYHSLINRTGHSLRWTGEKSSFLEKHNCQGNETSQTFCHCGLMGLLVLGCSVSFCIAPFCIWFLFYYGVFYYKGF